MTVELGEGTHRGVTLALELRLGAADAAQAWTITDGARQVPWAALGGQAGDAIRLRLVARDEAGRILQTVPADGTDRLLVVPSGDLGGEHWRV